MMNNSQENKFKIIEDSDIIVGIDIAKDTHWAVITTTNGKILMKSFYFNNTTRGFECLVENIEKVLMMVGGKRVIVGMEPTGHYWKVLAKYLNNKENIKVVIVNPYHVKKIKRIR